MLPDEVCARVCLLQEVPEHPHQQPSHLPLVELNSWPFFSVSTLAAHLAVGRTRKRVTAGTHGLWDAV